MPAPTTPAPRTRLLKRLAIAAAIALLAGWGVWMATRPKPVAVLVASASAGRVETTVANTRAGSVAACRRAKLAPPTGGRIAKLPVKRKVSVEPVLK